MSLLSKFLINIKTNPSNYWFKAKTYGWGWTPATWQGWLITGIYIILIILISSNVKNNSPEEDNIIKFVLSTLLLTSIFILIAYIKGEKPRWQWGKPKSK